MFASCYEQISFAMLYFDHSGPARGTRATVQSGIPLIPCQCDRDDGIQPAHLHVMLECTWGTPRHPWANNGQIHSTALQYLRRSLSHVVAKNAPVMAVPMRPDPVLANGQILCKTSHSAVQYTGLKGVSPFAELLLSELSRVIRTHPHLAIPSTTSWSPGRTQNSSCGINIILSRDGSDMVLSISCRTVSDLLREEPCQRKLWWQ